MLVPSDENECRQALTTAFRQSHPVAVRYPRGSGAGVVVEKGFSEWPWGKGVVRLEAPVRADARTGKRIAILAFGTLLHHALAEGMTADALISKVMAKLPLPDKPLQHQAG